MFRLDRSSGTSIAHANLLAQLGDQIALIAIPLLIVRARHGDAGDTSLLTFAATLPALLFAIPIGVLADRLPQRAMLVSGEAIRALSILAIVAAFAINHLPLWIIGALSVTGATGTVMFTVVCPSVVTQIAKGVERMRLNARIELARSLAFSAGPALGGLLVGAIGGRPALMLAATLSLAAVGLLTRIPSTRSSTSHEKRHPLHDAREGGRFLWTHIHLRAIASTALAFNIAWYVLIGIYVAYATHVVGLTDGQVGLTLSSYGGGMVIGASLLSRIFDRLTIGRLVTIGPICGFAASGLVFLTLGEPSLIILCMAFFLLGVGPVIWTITTTSIRQAVTPAPLMSRVSAFLIVTTAGARPLGALLGFAMFQIGGYTLCLTVSLIGFAVQLAIILGSQLRTVATMTELEPPTSMPNSVLS